MVPFMPPPPICTARPDQAAGSSTRKLIGLALLCPSTGAITPSTAQYGGAAPTAADQRGGSNVTPETGSLMNAAGTLPPRTLFEQSVSDRVRSTGVAAVATCIIEGRSDATSTSPNVTARLRVVTSVRKLISP